jgi:hypothetical protein
VYQAMVLILVGIPVYSFLKARRERLGLVDEPLDQVDDEVVVDLATEPVGA